MTKISIAVPSYNYAQYLEACLHSIQKQNYKNFEVLIADGGSSDASLEIIEKFCSYCCHMFIQVSLFRKASITNVAFERPFSFMN